MSDFNYKCYSCGKTFDKDFIENDFVYLCPECGKAEKNKPLEGVLTVEYDYDRLKKEYSREFFNSIPSGNLSLYPKLWPVDFNKISAGILEKLVLPSNQLLNYVLDGNEVIIQDETKNPTFSFKDRASILVALKAIELGIEEIAAASTGNAGSSLAGICARIGLKSKIYVPENIPDAKRLQIETYGSELVIVDGDYDLAFDTCLDDSIKNKYYNRNTAYNPLTIEGKKWGAYDIFINTKGNLPDNIFIPVGDGVIISGIYKGFYELKKLGLIDKLPRLIAVQSEGSRAVVDYLNEKEFEYKPAYTIADSISAGAPRNLYMAADAIEFTDGFAVAIEDDMILKAQKEFIQSTGILAEPSSAVTYAAFKKLSNNPEVKNGKNMLLITGNGLKDISSLEKINSL